MTKLTIRDRTLNRSKYLMSVNEALWRQAVSFHADALEPLLRQIRVNPTDRVLNLGGSVGLLAHHLASALNTPSRLILGEPDISYLTESKPEALFYRSDISTCNLDPLNIPFKDSQFDIIVITNFIRWIKVEELSFLLNELKRLLADTGKIVLIEKTEYNEHIAEKLRMPDDEINRKNKLDELTLEAQTAFEGNWEHSVNSIPMIFQKQNWSVNRLEGWFQPLRLNDSHWTDLQRSEFIDLEEKAGRARIRRLRHLLKKSNLWENEYGSLFRNLASDFQQKSLRLRKALETDEETGWLGWKYLMMNVSPNS